MWVFRRREKELEKRVQKLEAREVRMKRAGNVLAGYINGLRLYTNLGRVTEWDFSDSLQNWSEAKR